jgi:demethylmenaquinone methyltransferase/2-methoxy-6-polyprenyl-1,4-benzoquinol methylase/phosphoethanolamine N-methyltransferase
MSEQEAIQTEGRVIHWAANYDRMFRVITLGREGRFRQRIIEAAGLRPGDRVLDVGCGTGTLAIAAAEVVGSEGRVEGIDPSPEMIERARAKAVAGGSPVKFHVAAIEALPFADDSFDAVLSSLMFHHLTERLQREGLAELRRVLAPGGRLTIIDIDDEPWFHRLAARLARQHPGHDERGDGEHAGRGLQQLAREAERAGFDRVGTAPFKPRFLRRLSAEAAGGA